MEVVANGKAVALRDGATVVDLLAALNMTGKVVAVEHNGDALIRNEHEHRQLCDGDRVELVRAVAGGC